MEEKHVAKVTELLLAGWKMLAIHCATCRSPLFEHGGKVVCPVCGEREVEAPKPTKKPKPEKPAVGGIEGVLEAKLRELALELRGERDKQRIYELLGLMRAILEIREKL